VLLRSKGLLRFLTNLSDRVSLNTQMVLPRTRSTVNHDLGLPTLLTTPFSLFYTIFVAKHDSASLELQIVFRKQNGRNKGLEHSIGKCLTISTDVEYQHYIPLSPYIS
jgi:hypothetical protein